LNIVLTQTHNIAAQAMRSGAAHACVRAHGLWCMSSQAVSVSQPFASKQPQNVVINGKARAHRVQ